MFPLIECHLLKIIYFTKLFKNDNSRGQLSPPIIFSLFCHDEGKGGIMKEIRSKKIDFRVTLEEKSRIKEFAKQKGMPVGELIRNALMRMEALDKEGK